MYNTINRQGFNLYAVRRPRHPHQARRTPERGSMMKEVIKIVIGIVLIVAAVAVFIVMLHGGIHRILEMATVEPEQIPHVCPTTPMDDYCNISDHIIDHQYGCVTCRSTTSTDRKLWFDLMCRACFDAGRPVTARMVYLGQHDRQEETP